MSNITGLTVSIHRIMNRIKILLKPVSPAEDVTFHLRHCYQLRLET